MQRFDGNYGIAFMCGVIGALFVGWVPYLISLAAGDSGNFTWIQGVAGVFGLAMLLVMGLFLLHSASVASANYVVDETGITREKWTGNTTIAWSDLIRADECCTVTIKGKAGLSRRCALHGRNGQQIAISWPMVADCEALLRRLEPHLAPLRARATVELAKGGGVFRPDRLSGFGFLGFVAPVFLIGGLAGIDLSTTRPSADSRSLYYSSLSIKIRVTDAEQPVMERAVIRGSDGQSIAIESSLPGYRAILSLLRSRSGVKSTSARIDDPEFS
jgi:hypothetical protein